MQRSGEAAPRAETLSPAQWADVAFPRDAVGKRPFDYWQHEAADALHGWKAHEYNSGAPLQLLEADYRGALAAAAPEPGQPMTPHPGALPPTEPPDPEGLRARIDNELPPDPTEKPPDGGLPPLPSTLPTRPGVDNELPGDQPVIDNVLPVPDDPLDKPPPGTDPPLGGSRSGHKERR